MIRADLADQTVAVPAPSSIAQNYAASGRRRALQAPRPLSWIDPRGKQSGAPGPRESGDAPCSTIRFRSAAHLSGDRALSVPDLEKQYASFESLLALVSDLFLRQACRRTQSAKLRISGGESISSDFCRVFLFPAVPLKTEPTCPAHNCLPELQSLRTIASDG